MTRSSTAKRGGAPPEEKDIEPQREPLPSDAPVTADVEPDWDEAFFDAGERGEYEGGAARIAEHASALADLHEVTVPTRVRTADQERRRALFKRYVGAFVGVVGLVSVIELVVAAEQGGTSSANSTVITAKSTGLASRSSSAAARAPSTSHASVKGPSAVLGRADTASAPSAVVAAPASVSAPAESASVSAASAAASGSASSAVVRGSNKSTNGAASPNAVTPRPAAKRRAPAVRRVRHVAARPAAGKPAKKPAAAAAPAIAAKPASGAFPSP